MQLLESQCEEKNIKDMKWVYLLKDIYIDINISGLTQAISKKV